MGIDDEIVAILKAHTWTRTKQPKTIINQKGKPLKGLPWIQVTSKGKQRPHSDPDLRGEFKQRRYPYTIEIKGVTDVDMVNMQDDVEEAIEEVRIDNGWYEIDSEMEEEDAQGKLQSIILEGFKVLHK